MEWYEIKEWLNENRKNIIGYTSAVFLTGLLTFGLTKKHDNEIIAKKEEVINDQIKTANYFCNKAEKLEGKNKNLTSKLGDVQSTLNYYYNEYHELKDSRKNSSRTNYFTRNNNASNTQSNSSRTTTKKKNIFREDDCQECKDLFKDQGELKPYQRAVCDYLKAGRIRKAARFAEHRGDDYHTAINILENHKFYNAAARVAKREAKERGTITKGLFH